ncbi:peptide deformylase [Candidatus Saccharibacteria bacterium]|nr:peptide deformylase [Candidatus Saccharibacteria bacterium]MCL1963149.1 peptide deformylase [Candidatus Saccharibacteria bacterium]
MKSKFTKDDIITLPNPHLRERSKRITEIDDETLQLIDDMLAATLDWENSRPHEVAVALAAVQIDRLQRVVIVREDFDNKSNKNFTVLINPEIVKYEGEITSEQEGCLSIKDVYGLVPRHTKVRVKAIDISGHEVRFRSPNPFIARVLQHEIDHCNGICFIDHIVDQKDAFYILTESGDLEPIKYEKVIEMGILPNEE